MDLESTKSNVKSLGSQNWLEIVHAQVSSLRFGVVEIVVHDSRVVQIQKTERVRLDKAQTESQQRRTG